MNVLKKYFFSLIWVCFFLSQAHAYQYIESSEGILELYDQVSVFEDVEGNMPFSDVIEKDFSETSDKSFGHTNSVVWYKFYLKNKSSDDLYLNISPEWTHNLEVYKTDIKGYLLFDKLGGTLHPYSQRELKSNKHFFALELEQGQEAYYYVKIWGDHMITPHFELGDKIQMLEKSSSVDHFYFIYLGIILSLLSYNIFLAFIIKKPGYIFYSLYIMFMVASIFFVKGYINKLFDCFWFSQHSNIITAIMAVFITLSVAIITGTKQKYPKLEFVKKVIVGVSILSAFLNLFGFVLIANEIILNVVFLGGLWGLVVGFVMIKENKVTSKYLIMGFACFIIGGVTHTLLLRNLIPYNGVTHNAYLIGSGLEVIFLTLSFGINIGALRKQKYQAKLDLLSMAQENERLVLEQNKKLEVKVAARTKELQKTNDELQNSLQMIHEQKILLEEKQRNITDSINYSKNLQDALLCSLEEIEESGFNVGLFYEPKDVLSGDFYWFGKKDNLVYLAVADCTGHGVPGAMLSITGHNLLNRIVYEEKFTDVAKVLTQLHIELIALLHAEETGTEDGMDIQLICLDKESGEVSYAGAKNPLYYTNSTGDLVKIKADKCSIGGTQDIGSLNFTKHVLPIDWVSLFLFTDGYQDQFSEGDKKFMVGNYKRLLHEVSSEKPREQATKLKSVFKNWKGKAVQTDDVLVMCLTRK